MTWLDPTSADIMTSMYVTSCIYFDISPLKKLSYYSHYSSELLLCTALLYHPETMLKRGRERETYYHGLHESQTLICSVRIPRRSTPIKYTKEHHTNGLVLHHLSSVNVRSAAYVTQFSINTNRD